MILHIHGSAYLFVAHLTHSQCVLHTLNMSYITCSAYLLVAHLTHSQYVLHTLSVSSAVPSRVATAFGHAKIYKPRHSDTYV